ncbi:MAG: spermidine synthase [Planctomycetota bacterium]|nr:MAG: spermidine synthase [Planctomycetota bacterium]
MCALFFASGVAALVFETLWFRQAGLALGNTVWASSAVLSSFMGGLALGSLLAARAAPRLRRPLRLYAGLEVAVATTGLAITLLLPSLGSALAPLFGELGEGPGRGALRLLVAFGVLLFPATAMGATLPSLARALAASDPRFGSVLGRLYGFNTLGALVGALASEVFLVPALGIAGSAVFASALGLSAASLAAILARRLREAAPERAEPAVATAAPGPSPPLPAAARRLLAAAFVCGAALLALEVLWLRFLSLFVTATAVAFATLLALVLGGIALGGLVAGLWSRRRRAAPNALADLALFAVVLAVAGYGGFDPARGGSPHGYYTEPQAVLALGLPLVAPLSLVSGLLFTLQGAALHRLLPSAPGNAARAAGLLALANTAGGIAGAAGGGLLLLPALGLERSFFSVAVLYALAAALLARRPRAPGRRLFRLSLAAAALSTLVLFPFGALRTRYLAVSGRLYRLADGAEEVGFAEGPHCTVRCLRRSLLGHPLSHRLLTDGYSMSGSQAGSQRYMKLYAYLPAAIAPRLERALLIGYGVGQTASALVDLESLREIHVADPAPEVLAMSPLVHTEPGASDPLRDPRVRVHEEDGRFFLQTTSLRFDLITGEPPPPKVHGIVSLYTRELFQLARDRLRDGGLVTYWLPGHSLSEDDAEAIVSAFLEVFPNATLWNAWGLNLMLVGSRGDLPPVRADHLRRPWREPRLAARLESIAVEVPEHLGALFLADADQLRARLAGHPPLRDAWPYRLSARVLAPDESWRALSPWIDTRRARTAFARSRWIERHWPPELREATRKRFAVEGLLQQAPSLTGEPAPLETLDEALSQDDTRAVVLWLLGSEVRAQRIVERERPRRPHDPAVNYHLAARALSERRYRDAAERFAAVLAARPGESRVRLLWAYALVRAGARRKARAALREARRRGEAPSPNWAWLVRAHRL